MQIVIEISEEDKKEIDERLKDKGIAFWEHAELIKSVLLAVFHGTPLPKGHGDLIDKDKLWDAYMDADYDFYEALDDTPTVIKADRSEQE